MMSRVLVRGLPLLCLTLVLGACASLTPDFDPPTVTLERFQALPANDSGPRFQIDLRITNPNEMALDIAGVSYTVDLLGTQLIQGVSNDVPRIEGYSDGVVSVEAGVGLLQVVRLLGKLGRSTGEPLEYKLAAKIDFRGLVPTQRIEETGEIRLN